MACLVPPIRPLQLAATLDLAVARFRDAEALRQRLPDRKVIERAKGRLMAQHGLTEEQAFRRLRRAAMDAQRPLAEMASAVLLSGTARQQGHQDLL
jgi:response regulator NasT